MKKGEKGSSIKNILVGAASFVIIVAGLRLASEILVPFLLSAFIAIICSPPLFWMKKRGIPNAIAVLSILSGSVITGIILAAFAGNSLQDLSTSLPEYHSRLLEITSSLASWLRRLGIDISEQTISTIFDPGKAMQIFAALLSSLSGLFTNTFLIILTVIFILLEAPDIPMKLRSTMRDPQASMGYLNAFSESLNRYLALKTLFSMITGISVWVLLAVLGVDFSLLWGIVAFLFNYVPNIGSIIAAVPAVMLALIQLGFRSALLVCAGYLIINVTIGSALEPRFMGRGVGLSTLVVFLSLVFWGWVLGPVGMVLSVPLTMIVKIGLDSNEETRRFAVMLE